MLIRIHSDLHTEFVNSSTGNNDRIFDSMIPVIDGESDMVLVLAGDIVANIPLWLHNDQLDLYTPWLTELAQRHKAIVYVGGNHEGYNGSFKIAQSYLTELSDDIPNFYPLENDTIIIDGVKFLGTTKWTPLDGPYDQLHVRDMNDVVAIRGWNVYKWRQAYQIARYFLETELSKPHDGAVVVVTHHAPSYQSVVGEYLGSSLNCGYVSMEDDLMLKHQPDIWFHGHMHESIDYLVEDYGDVIASRVVCNPHGYYGEMVNPNYNPKMVIDI